MFTLNIGLCPSTHLTSGVCAVTWEGGREGGKEVRTYTARPNVGCSSSKDHKVCVVSIMAPIYGDCGAYNVPDV